MQYLSAETQKRQREAAVVRGAVLERTRTHWPNRLRCPGTMTLLDSSRRMEMETTHIASQSIRVLVPANIAVGQPCRIAFEALLDGLQSTVRVIGRVSSCTCAGIEGFRLTIAMRPEDEKSAAAIARLGSAGA